MDGLDGAKVLFEDASLTVYGVFQGSDTVVITYAPFGFEKKQTGAFGQKIVVGCGYDLIGFVPKANHWYPAPVMRNVDLSAILKTYAFRIAYGGSMGAHAAVRYSARFKVDCVLAMAPQYSIDPAVVGAWEFRFTRHFTPRNRDMTIRPEHCAGRIILAADPRLPADMQHYAKIAEQTPVQFLAAHHCGHSVVTAIASTRSLSDLLTDIRTNEARGVADIFRRSRKRSKQYRKILLCNLAGLRMAQGRCEQALRAVRAALASHPADVACLLMLSRVHAKMGRFGAAIEVARQARAQEPDAEWVVLVLVNALWQGGQRHRATVLCKNAVARSPHFLPLVMQMEMIAQGCDEVIPVGVFQDQVAKAAVAGGAGAVSVQV